MRIKKIEGNKPQIFIKYKMFKYLIEKVRMVGLEPITFGFGVQRSPS